MRNAVKATVDAYDGTVHIYASGRGGPHPPGVERGLPRRRRAEGGHPRVADVAPALPRRPVQGAAPPVRATTSPTPTTGTTAPTAGTSRPIRRTRRPSNRRTGCSLDNTRALTSVYVPREKSNLASFVSVNSDATSDDYGKISVLELPDERTDGPGQIANLLQTDDGVREELLGFTQGGVDPIYGNLLTLPVGDGLMYVQPVYTRRSGDAASNFPILRFVLVSYGDRIGVGTTLREAIADVLGVSADAPTPVPETEPEPDPETGQAEPEPSGSGRRPDPLAAGPCRGEVRRRRPGPGPTATRSAGRV
nr:UPF0182 family protein [Nocardioides sp. B-3]